MSTEGEEDRSEKPVHPPPMRLAHGINQMTRGVCPLRISLAISTELTVCWEVCNLAERTAIGWITQRRLFII